ncbi:hypothetical protein MC885_009337, partial [Smutsia gigantea]
MGGSLAVWLNYSPPPYCSQRVFLVLSDQGGGSTDEQLKCVVYGSWFDHVLSWEEHKHDKNILIMFYEEMKKDLSKSIKKITTFLSINVSDDEIDKIAWKTSFSEMKNNAAEENSDPNHTICALTSNRSLVFRKGAVGDWINYFTSKQKRVFDELFSEKMEHSELARH